MIGAGGPLSLIRTSLITATSRVSQVSATAKEPHPSCGSGIGGVDEEDGESNSCNSSCSSVTGTPCLYPQLNKPTFGSTAFCCEDEECLVATSTSTTPISNACPEGESCPERGRTGFVGWDEMMLAKDCEECVNAAAAATSPTTFDQSLHHNEPCCEQWNGIDQLQIRHDECCVADCFGWDTSVEWNLGHSEAHITDSCERSEEKELNELDCVDCRPLTQQRTNRSLSPMEGIGSTSGTVSSTTKYDLPLSDHHAHPFTLEHSTSAHLEELLKDLDPKTIDEILKCCCCGPESQANPTWVPSQHALHQAPHDHTTCDRSTVELRSSAKAQDVSSMKSPFFEQPSLSTKSRSLTCPPRILAFPCKWSDCNLSFSSKTSLASHVNGDHLSLSAPGFHVGASVANNHRSSTADSMGILLVENGEDGNIFNATPPPVCLWDDCAVEVTSSPIVQVDTVKSSPPSSPNSSLAPSMLRSSLDEGEELLQLDGKTSKLLRHLVEEHLAKLEPRMALALTESVKNGRQERYSDEAEREDWQAPRTSNQKSRQVLACTQLVAIPQSHSHSHSHSHSQSKSQSHPHSYRHPNPHIHGHREAYSAACTKNDHQQLWSTKVECNKVLNPSSLHRHVNGLRNRNSSREAQPYSIVSRKRSLPFKIQATSMALDRDRHLCRWEGCQLEFTDSAELMSHLSLEHVGSGKTTYDCRWESCQRNVDHGKGFSQRQKVMRHLQSHTGDRPFVCLVCDKSFSEATTLKQHVRVHTHERPYKCDQPGCDKSFSLASALTIHLRTHSGDRPFKCSFPGCLAAFSESSNLNKHIRTHRGERSYSCEECGRAFSRSDQLTRHGRTHELKSVD